MFWSLADEWDFINLLSLIIAEYNFIKNIYTKKNCQFEELHLIKMTNFFMFQPQKRLICYDLDLMFDDMLKSLVEYGINKELNRSKFKLFSEKN